MASAPLNWLLKIGGETLKTTAKTLSEAVNTLHDSVTSLSTTKADADTTATALDGLETNKLNISDLLSLEEIEASTLLTGKGVTAESAKQINDSLVSNVNQLKTNFQAGVDSIYDAVVAKGSTPASKSLGDVIKGINNIKTGVSDISCSKIYYTSGWDNTVSYTYTATEDCFVVAIAMGAIDTNGTGRGTSVSSTPSNGAVQKMDFSYNPASGNYKVTSLFRIYYMPKNSKLAISAYAKGYGSPMIYIGKLNFTYS